MPEYREHAPPRALERFIECGWSLSSPGVVTGHRVPPDGCLDIVYSRRDGLRIVGTMTAEQHFVFPQGASVVGVRFRPGMAGLFLGIAPSELTDRMVSLEDIWGRAGRALADRLNSAPSAAGCIELITSELRVPPRTPDPVRRAIEALTAAHGAVDLDFIARQANLSARQFRRRCLDESGLTPKHLCRILRFRHASQLAASGRLEWSAIAAEAGYFDQAHLIRDFREFTGRPPMAVFSNTDAGVDASMSA